MRRQVGVFIAAVLVAAAAMTAFSFSAAGAQTFLFEDIPDDEPSIGVTWQRPDIDGDSGLSIMSGVYDFSVNLPINARWSVYGSLPWVRIADDDESEDYVGNVLAGLKYLKRTGRKTHVFSAGAYFPTAEEDLGFAIFGMVTNGEDLFKYAPNNLTITGNYSYFHAAESGARLGLEIGPDIVIPTGDNEGNTELMAHYGVTAGFQSERLLAAVEVMGVVQLSSEDAEFNDRFLHSVNIGACYLSRHIRPGVFYKIYLKDEWRDLVDGVLGVKIELVM